MRRSSPLYPFTRLGLAFTAFLVVSHLAAAILYRLALLFSPGLLASPWGSWILNDLSIFGFGLAAFLLIAWTLPVYRPARRDEMTPGSFGAISAAAFGLMYLSNLFTLLLMGFLSAFQGGEPFPNPAVDAIASAPFLPNFIFGVVAAPLLEELIFRKLLLDRVRHWGDRLAILVSTFFFSLYHANLYQLFYAFTLGCLLAYLALRTGGIRYTVLLHALINLVGVGAAPLLAHFPAAGTFFSSLWVLACLGVGGWQCWKFWKRRVLLEGNAPFTTGQKMGIFFRSPGTIAFLAVSLALMLLNLAGY